MKKVLSFILVLSLVFALCACGGDKPESATPAAAAAEKSISEDFSYSDVKFVPAESWGEDIYVLDYKIYCNYEGKDIDNIHTFDLNYVVLDKDGVTIRENQMQVKNMFPGDIAWASAYDLSRSKEKTFTLEEIASIKSVKFTGYGKFGDTYEQVRFKNPIILEVAAPEVNTAKLLSDAEIASILSSCGWISTGTDSQGRSVYYADGTGVLSAGDFNFDMTWTNNANIVKTSYSYGGTDFSAKLELLEENGGYIIRNIAHPEVVWMPAN